MNTMRSCELCSGTIHLESYNTSNDRTGDSLECCTTLCEFCLQTKFHIGNFCFAILLGLSGRDGRIKSIIQNSSVHWLARKKRAKSSPRAENPQSNFFESVPEPQPPRQAAIDRDEVDEIVGKALSSAHEVDSMESLWLFVQRKGLEG